MSRSEWNSFRNQFNSQRYTANERSFPTIISTCCALKVFYNLWMFINFFSCSCCEEEKVRMQRSVSIEFTFSLSASSRSSSSIQFNISPSLAAYWRFRRRARLSHKIFGFGAIVKRREWCWLFHFSSGDLASRAITLRCFLVHWESSSRHCVMRS